MKLFLGLLYVVSVHAQNNTIPVRLSGSDGTGGDVEIYDKVNFRWRAMCDDGWNLRAATVVCRQLNFGPPLSIYSHSAGRLGVDYGIESVSCIGTESNIAQCRYSTNHDCYRNESAGVICGPIQIRLVDGVYNTWRNTTRDGRVEILSNGEWGTICDIGFDEQDAEVICKQLGFPGAKRLGMSGEYGNGSTNTPIHLSSLQCTGSESDIHLCMGNDNPIGCTHDNDVSVECLPLVQLTTGNATSDGLLQILYQGEWYTTCRPDYYYYHYYYYYHSYHYNNHADVVCRELGYDGGVIAFGGRRRLASEHIHQLWYYDLYCEGTEDSIYGCVYYNDILSRQYYCSYLAEYSCQNLRLNNETDKTGVLEFFDTLEWIPVCFTEAFSEYLADVTCRQLGYPFATNFSSVALPYERYGIGITGSVCEGANSSYIFNCAYFTNMVCQMQLYLTCYNSSNTVRLIGSPVEHMGRVEVYDKESDQWGTICVNDVSDYQYSFGEIICKSLGFSSYSTIGRASNYSNIGLSSNNPIITGPMWCTSSSYVYQNLYQCSAFQSHLGISPLRCTSEQELVVACNSIVILQGRVNSRYVYNNQGTVMLYNGNKNTYEYICDDEWDINDAHVICRMLGYPGALDAVVRSEYGDLGTIFPSFVSLSNVQCNGTEDSIFDCPHESNPYCSTLRSAGVQCLTTRLVDGPNQYSGRVEVYNRNRHRTNLRYTYPIFAQQWGTICDSSLTVEDATVLCRSLGYNFNEADLRMSRSYGLGTGPIWTSYIGCSGSEYYIWECSYRLNYGYSLPSCNHNMDIGITCSAPRSFSVRLQGSPHASAGRLEVWRNDMWGSVCNEHFTIEAANVVCRQLGFDQALDYTPGGYFGQSTGPIHMSNVTCTGNELSIADCTFSIAHSCDHIQDVGIFCQDIRLSNGTDATEGIIEINEDDDWRTICNDSFNDLAAAIVCKQLRFGRPVLYRGNSLVNSGAYHYYYYYYYSYYTPSCSENTQRLFHCFPYYIYYGSCYDTYLKCSNLRLEDGVANFSGRVEILYNDEWGTVCSDEFDENDAAVVCRQAGYGPPVRYWIDPSHRRHGRIWLDDLECLGTENTLSECQSSMWGNTNCDHNQDIFVECTGLCEQSINSTDYIVTYNTMPSYIQSTATLRCIKGYASIEPGFAVCGSDGEWVIQYPECEAPVRLIDESGSTRTVFAGGVEDISRGRVELLINKEWHTVCSQGFGLKEANVICNQLGLNGVRRIRTGYYGTGLGGIVAVKNRGCDGGETSILDCDLHMVTTIDLNCSHDQDIGIECLDVRLISTDSQSYLGRIEIFYNNEWGQLCFQENNATLHVICAQLGLGLFGAIPFRTTTSSNSRVWLRDSINCNGNENTLFDCLSPVDVSNIGKAISGICNNGAANVICPISACRPFLPPKNGYYVHDIQQVYYHPMNLLQIACKDGYDLISLGSDTPSGIAECQNGIWSDRFFCEKQIQLTYGFKHSAGHVEIFDKYHSDYKPVCDRNWDLNDANVICHQLGYPGAARATRRSHFIYGNNSLRVQQIPAIFSNVDCSGLEESIFDCLDIFGMPLDISTLDSCPSLRTAGVICNENIRLTGGSTVYEGQVEIFINNQWGTVCGDGIGENEAETLCQSLGFGPLESIINDTTGESTALPLMISDLMCSEYYDHFMKCTFNQSSPVCSPHNNLGLKCYPAVRFVEDGVRSSWEGEIEVYYGGQWDRVCNIDWDINDAEVVCREFGFDGAASAAYSRSAHEVFDTAILDGALCTGEELHLLDCPRFIPLSNVTNDCLGNYAGVTCMNECPLLSSPEYGRIVSVTGNVFNDITTFECYENFVLMGSAIRRCEANGQWSGTVTKCVGVRLAGGLNEAEGRVEIYYEGEWGTVCDQGWDINDATVVCHQLGYQQALVIMIEASSFDPGSGPIHLQDVACLGNESNLFVCPTSKNTSACSHNQDAGVICADCPVLQQPEYGSVYPILSNPQHGDNASISCNDGYNLFGSAERTCMPNGVWSGTTVTCQATCKIEDATKNEKVKVEPVRSQYIEGDQVIIVCNSEYQMVNNSEPIIVRICMSNQTWSGLDPHCEKTSDFSTSTSQSQANSQSDISNSTTVIIVLAAVLGLIMLIVVIGIVIYIKKRMGNNSSTMKTSTDDKQMFLNPVFATDEASETS